jgi:hypothetical protein
MENTDLNEIKAILKGGAIIIIPLALLAIGLFVMAFVLN